MPYDAAKKLQRFSVNGQRFAMAWGTKAEGEAWEALARLAIAQGKPVPGRDNNAMPGAEVKRRSLGGRDVGTLANVLRTVRKNLWEPKGDSAKGQILFADIFTRWCGPNVSASDAFTQDKIEEFVDYLRDERRVANSTINKYLSAVRALARHAGLEKGLTLPWFEKPEGRVRFFTDEEKDMVERQWRLWGRDREADFWVFLLATGGRPYIDAGRLRWTEVFEAKGGRPAVHYIAAKGGNARTVPLSPEAHEALARQDRSLPGPWSWAHKDDMRRLWSKTQAAFPRLNDAVLYCCRHTFGTELYRKSRDIKLVKDMMGHKHISTTEIYVHVVGNEHSDIVADLMSRRQPILAQLANT